MAVGCDSRGRLRLNRAEAIMESSPDSALHILDSIDSGSLNRSSDRALHALLSTQARIKTYEPLTDDSLISGAVSYFTDHGPDSNLMKALFYQAEIRKNDLQYAKAIIPAMRSRELAIKIRNPYWHAKASELISDIYNATYYEQEALKYNLEAIDNYKQAGKIANHRFSLCDRALLLNRNNNTPQALNIIDSIYNVASQDNEIDSIMMWQCLDYKYSICMLSHLLEKADSTYALLLEIGDESELPMQEIAWKVEIEISKNNLNYFDSIYSQSLPLHTLQDSLAYIITAIKYYELKGDLEKSLILKDSLLSIQNREVTDVLEQSVVAKQRDFYDLKVEAEKQKSSQLHIIIVFSSIFFIIIFLIIILIHKIRIKAKNLELEGEIKNILLLSHELEQQLEVNRVLSSTIKKRELEIDKINVQINKSKIDRFNEFKERWNTLVFLCGEYYEMGDSDKEKIRISKQIKSEIQKFSNRKNIEKIEKTINEYTDNLLMKLRQQCNWIKEEDMSLIIYLYAGFPSKAICFLLDLNLSNYYSRKRRLIEKIQKGDAEDKQLFIDYMK